VFSLVLQASSDIRVNEVASSTPYSKGISALLVIGLFASVYGISRPELRRNARIVLVAITLGVAFKAVLTGGVMILVLGGTGSLLLGVAVAQIDPLSVAASLKDSTMSERAKSVLSAWASFDDPVTVLLVAYLATLTLPAARGHDLVGAGGSFLAQAASNVALVAFAGAAWFLLAVRPGQRRQRIRSRATRVTLTYLVLVGLLVLAASFGLFLGIAACALFYRPPLGAVAFRVVEGAFYVATFLLGMLLVVGVNVWAGLLLGATVFFVQIVAGLVISRGMPSADRVHLALGQQNGLTAIILALALQPYLPSAVGTVAIAILLVNVLHIVTNRTWGLMSACKHSKPPTCDGRPNDVQMVSSSLRVASASNRSGIR
jgi:hypothetical protein